MKNNKKRMPESLVDAMTYDGPIVTIKAGALRFDFGKKNYYAKIGKDKYGIRDMPSVIVGKNRYRVTRVY